MIERPDSLIIGFVDVSFVVLKVFITIVAVVEGSFSVKFDE